MLINWIRNNHARMPSLRGQLVAMIREAAADISDTMHRVFFGQPVRPGEPGTPMVPTQAQVSQQQGNVRPYNQVLEDAAARGAARQQQARGIDR